MYYLEKWVTAFKNCFNRFCQRNFYQLVLHLRGDGNEADCKMHLLMPRSPILFKLETTWQIINRKVWFLNWYLVCRFLFCVSERNSKYLDICRAIWYHWNTIYANKERCSVKECLKRPEKLNLIGFPLPHRKSLLFKRLNSFEFRIKKLCCPNRWKFFFEQTVAVVRTAEYFSECRDNPSHMNGNPFDLNLTTNS